jgi:beta-galactosidase
MPIGNGERARSFHSDGTFRGMARVETLEGIPTLYVNDHPMPPFAYMSYLGEVKYYREVADVGIHLFAFPAYLGDRGINTVSGIGPFKKPIWIGENQFDFSSIQEEFDKLIAADAQAKVFIRFYLDPPLWWEIAHPDACCQREDGSTFRQCFSSDKWRAATAQALQQCIAWIARSAYASHLIGVHVAAGFTEEWFYHPQQYRDCNPLRAEAFRAWLKKKYKSVAKLRRAWDDSFVTFEEAELGSIPPVPCDRWRDPAQERQVFDTYRFHAETLVDNIAYFCRFIKEISGGSLLTGTFYGYHLFVTDAARGHGALARLLQSPHLDYLSSPNTYHRVVGEDWPPMAAVQSIHRHGKLWLAENDTRTYLTTPLKAKAPDIAPPHGYEGGVWCGPPDAETSVALLWKNAGRMLTQGYGGWWFDMWGGWFSHPQLLDVIGKSCQLYATSAPSCETTIRSQVCVLVDEEISFWDAGEGRRADDILSNQYALGKSGAPYDMFLRSDIENIPTDQYQLIWLLGCPRLRKKEKHLMREWQQNGKRVLWTNFENTQLCGEVENSLISGVSFSATQLRALFLEAGVHIFISAEDVFYAGGKWLCLHTKDGGQRTLNLPFAAEVTNAVTGEKISSTGNQVTVELPPKSTTLLRLKPSGFAEGKPIAE